MKFHEGTCEPNTLCRQEHRYRCANCDTLFTTDINTQVTPLGQKTLPTKNWPACSEKCAQDLDIDWGLQQSTNGSEAADLDEPVYTPIDEGDLHD